MFKIYNFTSFEISIHPWNAAAAAVKSLQSCPTLCDPIDGSPSGSSLPGILQARTLEWVAISFSNAWKWKVKVKSISRVQLLSIPWTAAYQAPPPMGFSRQEYWSGVPLPSPTFMYTFGILSHVNILPYFKNEGHLSKKKWCMFMVIWTSIDLVRAILGKKYIQPVLFPRNASE